MKTERVLLWLDFLPVFKFMDNEKLSCICECLFRNKIKLRHCGQCERERACEEKSPQSISLKHQQLLFVFNKRNSSDASR